LDEHSTQVCAEKLILFLHGDLYRRNLLGKRVPVAFSGGLDSTLVAKVCSVLTETYCIVAGAEDSTDMKNARASAKRIGLELLEVAIDEDDVVDGAKEICRITGLKDPVTVSFELPTYFAMKSAAEDVIVTGQGADELFGGYAKYESMELEEFRKRRMEDIDKAMGEVDCAERAIAAALGKEIIKPFLCNRVVSFAMDLQLDSVYPDEVRKRIIREALKGLGLSEIAAMPKKAAQYGSGVSAMLKSAANKKGESVREMIEGFAEGSN
jgi:asparagine synthase (glutamine-hydrolysing)